VVGIDVFVVGVAVTAGELFVLLLFFCCCCCCCLSLASIAAFQKSRLPFALSEQASKPW
jgi:hypothetical protein